MTILTYETVPYLMNDNESVLNCLLRHDIEHPHSCQSGVCQSCLIKSDPAMVEPSWQEGISDTLKKQGYFLACMAYPKLDIQLENLDSDACNVTAVIISMEKLSPNVVQLKLLTDTLDDWIPGQFLSFITPTNITRSYSIANIPSQDGYIELHIKLYPGGAMSTWIEKNSAINTQIKIRGSFGKCFYYNPQKLKFDMLLVGTGTGLAPLIAIVKSALFQDHDGQITLIHGGLTDQDIYYGSVIEALVAQHDNLHYAPCVLKSKGCFPENAIDQQMLSCLIHPATMRLYVCGPKETTVKLKTKAFIAGVPSGYILSDEFL